MAAREALSGGAPRGPGQTWVEVHAASCGCCAPRPGASAPRPRALCTQATGLRTQAAGLVARHLGRAGTLGEGAGCAGTVRRRLAAGSGTAKTQLCLLWSSDFFMSEVVMLPGTVPFSSAVVRFFPHRAS